MEAHADELTQPLIPAAPADEEAALPLWHPQDGSAVRLQLAHATEVEELPAAAGKSSLLESSANATNAILGAGMFALPRAFAGLGLVLGCSMTLGTALLMYASCGILIRAAARSGRQNWTYAGLLSGAWGRRTALAVRASILAIGLGFLVLYMVVTAEMLLGTEEISGLIPDLAPSLPRPLPWWLGRTPLLCYIALALAPLLSATSLRGAALVSVGSVACSVGSCLVLLALCIAGGMQGELAGASLWPDPSVFGAGALARATGMLATSGVFLTAYVLQHMVPPLTLSLSDPTPARQNALFACALSASAAVYLVTGVSGATLFGSRVAGDVLASMDVRTLARLLWGSSAGARAVVVACKGTVVGALLTSCPITAWPCRNELIDLLLRGLGGSQVSRRVFLGLTYALLALVLLLAICVRSMYQLAGLIGSVSGIALAFVFPGLLALRDPCPLHRALGWALLPTGALLMAAGLVTTALGQGGT